MEGSTPQTFSRELKRRRIKRINFKQNKKKFLIGFGIAGLIVLAGAGYALYEYLKPMYVIGDAKITREDISQYAKALDSYKAANKDIDYGGNHRDVAVDDLVLNAAFIFEMDRRNDDRYKQTQELMKKRYDAQDTTPEVKKMLRTRAENEAYRKTMSQDLLAVKDILVVNIPLDSPLYLEKSPEEIKKLRGEAFDRLQNEFLPLMENGASKEEIGAKADVAVYDRSRAEQNAGWEQYTKKNVTIASLRENVIVNKNIFNDQDVSDYYGVPVEGLQSTSEKIAQLGKVGETTGVFASKAGMYMIARLEKNAGGPYGSWEEFLKTYKQKYVNSKFASVVNPESTLMSLSDKATQALTTPGLEQAKAQIPGGCNAHLVNFRFTSFDVNTLARIGGTAVTVNRAGQHVCGDQWEGTRGGITYPGNNVFDTLTIQDNCWGNQLTFGILAHPANYTFVAIWTSEGYLQNPYPGWPIWTSGHINQVGDIFTDFHYVGNNPPPDTGSSLDVATCTQIAGWIYDKRAWAWTPTVKIYFDARPGQPGSKLWDIGAATATRTDVGTAYPHTQNTNNHGFSVDPRKAPASVGINIQDGNSHRIYLYASSLSPGNPDYEFASSTIAACPAPPPTDSAMTPIATASLLPDNEEPNEARFSARVDHTGAAFNATVLREFFILRSGSTTKEFITPSKFTTAPASPTSNPISGTINNDWGPENLAVTNPVDAGKLNLKVGDRVCSRVTVTPGRVTVNYLGAIVSTLEASRTSNDQCDTLVSKPYVSVYGNDVAAGASFSPSCATTPTNGDIRAFNKTGSFRGSGVQLAALAFGSIDGFASSFLTPKKPTYLTFANTSGTYGSSYGTYRCLPDYFGGAPATATSGPINLNGDGQRRYNPGGSKAVIGSNTNVADQSAIYVDGDVVITGNIEYKQNWNSPKDIPSLYVIARGNIYISKNVSRLDGTFVAQPKDGNTGRIYTCSDPSGNLFPAASLFSECDDNQLTVYGSFIAQQVRLLRTKDSLRDSGGDSASTSRAAEVFRFSPETYLATPAIPALTSGTGSKAQFYTTLPPVL